MGRANHHIVAMPYPGRGHINPMMSLCKLLLTKHSNLTITFIITEEWFGFIGSAPKPPAITFRTIPNVIPSELIRASIFPEFVKAVYTKMEAPVEEVLDKIEGPPVRVMIADTYVPWAVELGRRRNFPVVSLWPMSPVVFSVFYHFDLLEKNKHFPVECLAVFLQAVSWLAIGLLPPSSISIFSVTFFLLLSNLGASIVEVANDALVAETGKEANSSKKPQKSSSGGLQSFVWMCASIGGVLGNLIGGLSVNKFSYQTMFLAFGVILVVQLLATIRVRESSLNLPKTPMLGIQKQLSELIVALKKPEITYLIAWLAVSYALIPVLTGTMFFYQTQYLKLDSSVLGISKVFGQAALLLWSVVYNAHLKLVSPRKLISGIQVAMAIFMVSDFLFVQRIYLKIGIPDSVYVVIISGMLEVVLLFKVLPYSVLLAQLCPQGCEGSLMAFLMSTVSLACIVSGYLGVALASLVGITANDFSGLPLGIIIQAVCTLLPLFLSSWIPGDVKSKED